MNEFFSFTIRELTGYNLDDETENFHHHSTV